MAQPHAAGRPMRRVALAAPLLLLLARAACAAKEPTAAPAHAQPQQQQQQQQPGRARRGGQAVQLSSSVMIFGNKDLDQPTPEASQCGRMLRRAAEHGSRSVNIVRGAPGRVWGKGGVEHAHRHEDAPLLTLCVSSCPRSSPSETQSPPPMCALSQVVTQYWVDDRFKGLPKTCNPDNWATPSRVDSYCQCERARACEL